MPPPIPTPPRSSSGAILPPRTARLSGRPRRACGSGLLYTRRLFAGREPRRLEARMGWSAWLTHERECAADGHAARAASSEILSGDSADVYFACRAHPRGRRPRSARDDGGLHPPGCRPVRDRRGEEPARARARRRRSRRDRLEALDDGDRITSKEVVLRIRARYRRFGLYETAFLGMLAQSTGWATAASECVEAAKPNR